ncbi:MAG: bifunctional precorrin-2 dehydrogenase/sirohydrochlorin ferrochelatase [Bryobacterales bacterium]|nr:bifunctional precorrin-2 dehydrogenase/sirohydrochlorin ferrochelatase [Bryobacterales bacterium]
MYYPVFLDLHGKTVLVVGAGKVALRKARGLVEAGAAVTVVSPAHLPEFEELPVELQTRRFRRGDIGGQALVFAATNDRAVNRQVAQAAGEARIPVNVADAPEECAFLVPSRIRKGNLQVAVSTGGESPKLAVALRKKIEEALSTEG